jgi:saccharopine dehydrogenase-like NADP-dependent oxidoreductase
MIDNVKQNGGKVKEIWYHVGVLPKRSNINPLGYRCFWAAEKCLRASLHIKDSSADWICDGKRVVIKGKNAYLGTSLVEIPGIGIFESRPNSDSCAWLYPSLYGVPDITNFYQGTLRFIGWGETFQGLIELGFANVAQPIEDSLKTHKDVILKLCGNTKDMDPKKAVALKLNIPLYSDVIRRFDWLGLFSDQKIEVRDSYCDFMTNVLVKALGKFQDQDEETDQVIMYYRMIADYPNKQQEIISLTHAIAKAGSKRNMCSKLTSQTAAMIARMILENSLNLTGLHYPLLPEVYNPVLEEYEKDGIICNEEVHDTLYCKPSI